MAPASFSVPGLPPMRVQVGTFNCNLQGASTASPDMTHWLVPTVSEKSTDYVLDPSADGRPAPDLYAVGFQELLPLHDGFANNEKAQEAIKRTDRAIRRAIRPQSALTRRDGKYPDGGGPEDYTLVATEQVVGIVLFVYARERAPTMTKGAGVGVNAVPSVVERIKEIRTGSVSTGFFNLLGNKGAAGVRIVLGGAAPGLPDETFTFVCAHLTAHDHNVPRRNADWRNIVSRLVFAPDSVVSLPEAPINVSQSGSSDEKRVDGLTEKYETAYSKGGVKRRKAKALDDAEHGVYETSHLFVFGDLNYRIGFNIKPSPLLARKGSGGEALTKKDVKRKINQADWKTLATYDQLTIEHSHPSGPRTLHGLVEPSVTSFGFAPTYKYKVDKAARKKAEKAADQDERDVLQPEPLGPSGFGELSGKRVPGWTDRILWASAGGDADGAALHGVEPELFRSVMRYTHSDHKPVTAILRLSPAAGKHLDANMRPYPIDGLWRIKRNVGFFMDRGVGFVWCALVAAGAGNTLIGIAELVVVAAMTVWWLGVGGGQRGDMGYMLGNLLGRP